MASLITRSCIYCGCREGTARTCPNNFEHSFQADRKPEFNDRVTACPIHGMVHEEGTECPACKKEKAPRYKNPNDHRKDMLDAIDGLEDKVIKLLIEGKHDKNKRRHDHAANSLEEGFMWLRKAVMKNDDEV